MSSLARRYYPLSLPLVEDVEEYRPGGFHPVHVGDVFQERFKVLHKLGSGGSSTTWLARDNVDRHYVALKILKAEESASGAELRMLQSIAGFTGDHPGRQHIRLPLHNFLIEGPNGCHGCLVTDIAGPSLKDLYNVPGKGYAAGARRLRAELAKRANAQVVEAVEFLHCSGVVHGGPPRIENIGLPFMYRAPKTIFTPRYDEKSEIWALACLLFEIRAGNPLFTSIMGGADEAIQQIVQMKGKLPEPWWHWWDKRKLCFDDHGKPLKDWPNGKVLAVQYPLEEMIGDIGSEDDDAAVSSGPAVEMLESS